MAPPQTQQQLIRRFERLLGKSGLRRSTVRAFQKLIYHRYKHCARTFPWRMTNDPYAILVSEIMLQQTQTQRVAEKYEQFIKVFPSFASLARAPLRKILTVWKGLGYNRRALALKNLALIVVTKHGGSLPSEPEALMSLPGIGRASAAAIAAFAFNKPSPLIETNIRSVFIHFFFHGRNRIGDAEIIPLVEQTLDASNPRTWYYALMDYGVMLKKTHPNPTRRSAHYHRQTPFKSSNRRIRGMILKSLITTPNMSARELAHMLGLDLERLKISLAQLHTEGFVTKSGKRFEIP